MTGLIPELQFLKKKKTNKDIYKKKVQGLADCNVSDLR